MLSLNLGHDDATKRLNDGKVKRSSEINLNEISLPE